MAAFNSVSQNSWMEISHHHNDLHLLYCSLQVAILMARSSPPAIHHTLLCEQETLCYDKDIDGTCHIHGSVFTSQPLS